VIPDLIEIGCDILNPVQVSAPVSIPGTQEGVWKGPRILGRGVDTQVILGSGTRNRSGRNPAAD